MTLMERRRALMAVKKGGGLPSIYQQVEWIESSGTQAIITPCWLKQNTEVYCEFIFTGRGVPGGYPLTFGCANPSLGFSREQDTGSFVYCSFGNRIDKTIRVDNISFFGDNFHSVSMNANRTVIDGQYSVEYSATVTENESRKIAVFARMSGSNTVERFAQRRIRVLRITEGNTISLDLVPCYRKSDGEIGMYDLVSKTFLTNAGTGTFTKGADVN